MRETAKLAVRLMVFALVSALMLAVINNLTKDTIAQNEQGTVNAARAAVLGDYEFEITETDLTEYPAIQSVYAGYDGDRIAGYVYELQAQGFAGLVSMSLGIDASGTVVGLNVTSHVETKGLGSDAEGPFLASFIGLNAAGTYSDDEARSNAATDESPEPETTAEAEAETGATQTEDTNAADAAQTAEADAETGATQAEAAVPGDVSGTAVEGVDGMTGATYSTNAVKTGVAEALRHFAANYLGGEESGR